MLWFGIILIAIPVLTVLGFMLADLGLKDFLICLGLVIAALAMSLSISAGIFLISNSL